MKQQHRLRDSLLLLLSFCSVAATVAIGSDDFDEESSDDSNDVAAPTARPQQNLSEKSAGEAAVEVSPSVQLHNMLAAANHYSEELEGRLKKAQDTIITEKEREGQLEAQANHTLGQYKEAVVEAKRRLRVLQRNNSNLLESLHNATAAQTEVQQKLLLTNRSLQKTGSELGVVKAQLNNSGGTRQDFERVRQALKRAEDQATTEGKRTKEEWTAMQTALHQLVQVKHELDVSKQQLADEVAQEAVLNQTSNSQIEKLQNERADNEKKLVQENTEVKHRLAQEEQNFAKEDTIMKSTLKEVTAMQKRAAELERARQSDTKEIAFLKRRVADGDNERQRAQGAVKELQSSLARASAEVEQLKGSVPMFQARIAADQRELKKVTIEKQSVLEERDVSAAMLDEAKEKLAKLEQQYAGVVQNLARVQSAASPTDSLGVSLTVPSEPPNLADVASWTSDATESESSNSDTTDADSSH